MQVLTISDLDVDFPHAVQAAKIVRQPHRRATAAMRNGEHFLSESQCSLPIAL
nr:hypothetical protein OG781_42665 [Streptomyces sp. NBC_00830]